MRISSLDSAYHAMYPGMELRLPGRRDTFSDSHEAVIQVSSSCLGS
jgi:hypothetical protein